MRAARKMARAYARNSYSLNSVGEETVVAFLKELNPKFIIPSRRLLKGIQQNLADEIQMAIRDIVHNSPKVGAPSA